MIHQVCWLVWLVGTALIILSWTSAVSTTIGWIGFGVACAAALITYLPQRTPRNRDWALLTTDMLEANDYRYDAVMEHLQSGRPVWYDGLGFSLRPENEFALVIVASVPVHALDEERVVRDVARAKSMFEKLTRTSPELAGIASGKALRISVMSDDSEHAFEVCRIINDRIEWKVSGRKPAVT